MFGKSSRNIELRTSNLIEIYLICYTYIEINKDRRVMVHILENLNFLLFVRKIPQLGEDDFFFCSKSFVNLRLLFL
jgi:hypothetical protein